jgi:FtsZ-binding cell division protein ZapB
MTKAEKMEKLESYAEELKNELAAVQERIKELKTSK